MEKQFEYFLPSSYDYTTDDAAAAMETAAAYSSATGETVVFGGGYRLKSGVHVSTSNVKFRLSGSTFYVEDTPAMVRTVFSGEAGGTLEGRIGILWTSSGGSLTGHGVFAGLGIVGATSLGGLCFYDCLNTNASATLTLKAFAGGRFSFWNNGCEFGDVFADHMNGVQTFSPTGNAGSACIPAGNQFCKFGHVVSKRTFKPARYASTVAYKTGAKASNRSSTFGNVVNYAEPSSAFSSALSIRAAENCTFGNVINHGATIGLNVERYVDDTGYSIDGVTVGDVISFNNNRQSSLSCAVNVSSEASSHPVGTISIGRVMGRDCGDYGYFGKHVGAVTIDHLLIDGADRMYGVEHGFHSFKGLARNTLLNPYIGVGASTNIQTQPF